MFNLTMAEMREVAIRHFTSPVGLVTLATMTLALVAGLIAM